MLIECRAVLFDCDGVLVDSDASVDNAWRRWAAEVGLDVEHAMFAVHGRRSSETVAALLPPDQVPAAIELIDRIEIEDAGSVTAIPGARELTASMPAGSWAVVTSGNRRLATARLRAAGLPLPTVIVTADDVSAGKPDPEGYARAARELGVPAAATCVLEDSAVGMQAGRGAGASHVIGVGARSDGGEPDVRVSDLRALTWTDAGLRVD